MTDSLVTYSCNRIKQNHRNYILHQIRQADCLQVYKNDILIDN